MSKYQEVLAVLERTRQRPVDVVGFGESTVDLICRVPVYPVRDTKVRMEPLLRAGGGQIATACSLCARFGLRTVFVGRIGDDDLGAFLARDLAEEPLDLILHSVVAARTHLSVIIVDRATGGRTIVYDRDPRLGWRPEEVRSEWIQNARILHLDTHEPAASTELARQAHARDLIVALDIDIPVSGWDELAAETDLLICGSHFLETAFPGIPWEEGLTCLAGATRGLAIATRGSQGAAVWVKERVEEFPAFTVDVVDSTGAGDMFHGAFLFGVLQGWTLEATMEFANAAGALACRAVGARNAIPTLEAVRDLIGTRVSDLSGIRLSE